MAEKTSTAEQKLAALKLKLTEELLGFYKIFIKNFNTEAYKIFQLIHDSRKDEGETVVIRMTKDEFGKLYNFFKRAEEADLVDESNTEYEKEQCRESQIKEKILKEL